MVESPENDWTQEGNCRWSGWGRLLWDSDIWIEAKMTRRDPIVWWMPAKGQARTKSPRQMTLSSGSGWGGARSTWSTGVQVWLVGGEAKPKQIHGFRGCQETRLWKPHVMITHHSPLDWLWSCWGHWWAPPGVHFWLSPMRTISGRRSILNSDILLWTGDPDKEKKATWVSPFLLSVLPESPGWEQLFLICPPRQP